MADTILVGWDAVDDYAILQNGLNAVDEDGDTVQPGHTENDVYMEAVIVDASFTQTLQARTPVLVKAVASPMVASPNTGKTHTIIQLYLIGGNKGMDGDPSGELQLYGCNIHGYSNRGVELFPATNGTLTLEGNVISSGGPQAALWIRLSNTGTTANVKNNTGIQYNSPSGIEFNSNAGTYNDDDNFAHSRGGNDYNMLNGAALTGTNFSTDGTQGTNDIGTLDDAKIVDPFGNFSKWELPDPRVKPGSALLNVGSATGTVRDYDYESVDKTVVSFAGCGSDIAATPSAPANGSYIKDGNIYHVSCDTLASELLGLECRITVSATLYYMVSQTSDTDRVFGFKDDDTVDRANVNKSYFTFESSETITKIEIRTVNQNKDGSGWTEISANPDFISLAEEALRNTDPGEANVLIGNSYKIQNVTKNGLFDEAARNTDPGVGNVLVGAGNYKIQGVTKTPTFNEAARNTDPGEGNVAIGTPYKIQDVSKVGTLAISAGLQVDVDIILASGSAESYLYTSDRVITISGTITPSNNETGVQCILEYKQPLDVSWTEIDNVTGVAFTANTTINFSDIFSTLTVDSGDSGSSYEFRLRLVHANIIRGANHYKAWGTANNPDCDTTCTASSGGTDSDVEDFINEIVNLTGPVTWYQRIVSSQKPDEAFNVDVEQVLANPTLINSKVNRVSEATSLFTNKGLYNIAIRRSPGTVHRDGQISDMTVKSGRFDGTCVPEIEVKEDDHLIDTNGEEYVVISSNVSTSNKFRHLELVWLPPTAS